MRARVEALKDYLQKKALFEMKIIGVIDLALADIKVIRFARFNDHRGYFIELYRKSDFQTNPATSFMRDVQFSQCNESFSKKHAVRGLHFQFNPYMGKLVRTVRGHMVDLVLDIRKGSPTFGKIIGYDMPADVAGSFGEWIWVPPGFAHGNMFLEDTMIEYFCTGEYSPGCEVGISPLAADIDWSLCDARLKALFHDFAPRTPLITDKDKAGLSVSAWEKDDRSAQFIHGHLPAA
jgi:dTDP-4-dehydrorhamnose 3,5-epimerase